jgi:putative ABC transport system substrate-binding protein
VSIQRRKFITLLGGATAWPLAASAQQAMPVIGYLGSMEAADEVRLRSFRQGLSDTGFIEGQNVTIEYRWSEDVPRRGRDQAADLVRRNVNVIVGVSPTAAAAKALTDTIPIVFWGAPDPVQAGLVTSLSKPNGNVTGVTSMGTEVGGKQLSLARQLLPSAVRFALLLNPTNMVFGSPLANEMQSAAAAAGSQIEVFSASTIAEIDGAFANIADRKIEALFVSPGIFFTNRRVQFATLATRYALPTIYPGRGFVEAGGLMSYGTSNEGMDRQVGIYVGRILKGEKPGNLPVIRPSKFELVINLQTARTLGLTVPPNLLAIADGVIE